MVSIEEKQQKIDLFLLELKNEVENCDSFKTGKLKSVIVTGSYAAYKLNPDLGNINWNGVPDVNIYGLVSETNVGHLQAALDYANVLKRVVQKTGFNVMLDLHPFYKSYGTIKEDEFNLQITSRILNINNIDQYPLTFWYGWQSCFYELCTNEPGFFASAKFKNFERNKKWLTDSYMALASYNNAVHMAVMSSMFENKEHVFVEVFRYIKEVLKDGIALGISVNDEFDNKNIKAWKKNLVNFYSANYGEETTQIVARIKEIDNNYFDYYKKCDIIELVELFSMLLDIVFKKGFCMRKFELFNDNDVFNDLPLWY